MKAEQIEQEIQEITEKINEILETEQEERYQLLYVKEREIPENFREKDEGIYYLGVMTRSWFFHQNPIAPSCFGNCRSMKEIVNLCRRIRWILYHLELDLGSDELAEDIAYLENNQVDEVLLCNIANEHLQKPVKAVWRLAAEYQQLGNISQKVRLLIMAVEILGNKREFLLEIANVFLELGNLKQALQYIQRLEEPSEEEMKLMQSIEQHLMHVT